MAGRPQRRARLEQLKTRLQELEPDDGTLEGVPMAGSTAPPSADASSSARPRTRDYARETARENVSRTVTGSETRRAIDHANASELAQLTQALRPGLRVQIERSKPHWCAGIVEPSGYIVRQGGVPALLSYIREEWGGAAYRLTILQPNGTVAYESQVSISAPPRFEGREIYRASWGGEAEPVKREQAPVRNPEAQDTFAMIERVVRIVGSLQEGKSTQLDALREQNQELIAALRDIRHAETASPPAAPRQTLADQLGELLEAHRAVEQVGKMIGGSKREREPNEEREPDDGMGAAVKEGMKHFIGNAMASMLAPGAAQPPTMPSAPPRAPAPARARPPENVQVTPQKMAIPMAGIAGQKTGS